MKFCTSSLILILFCAASCVAQKQGNIWCFNDSMMLDFNRTPPVVSRSSAFPTTGANSACISDRNTGELLFYTSGYTVWNRRHQIMFNGTQLYGYSATQPAIVIPHPQDTNLYYIFTSYPATIAQDSNPLKGIFYSVVDMRLDNNLGGVTVKNVHLLDSATQRLTATQHANGRDYWIVAQWPNSNCYYAWLLTPNGIEDTVVSCTGPEHPMRLPGGYEYSAYGQMKISPDGTMLAVPFCRELQLGLFDFNPATGVVSNPRAVADSVIISGISFSACSKKLYANHSTQIFQLSVENPSVDSIRASLTYLTDRDAGPHAYSQLFSMQLGPDGKIYIHAHYLHIIAHPDATGVQAGLQVYAISIPYSNASIMGLPNFVDAWFRRTDQCDAGPLSLLLPDTILCEGLTSFQLPWNARPDIKVLWRFPGGSPSSSTDTLVNVLYDSPGQYPVTLSWFDPQSGYDTISGTVTVLPAPQVHAGNDTAICLGGSLRLQARLPQPEQIASFRWIAPDPLPCDTCRVIDVRPQLTTSYILAAVGVNGCTSFDTVTVDVTQASFARAAEDTTICVASTFKLGDPDNPTTNIRYSWSPTDELDDPASPNPTATPSKTTTWVMEATDTLTGCIARDTITISVLPLPQAGPIGDTTLCDGGRASLRAFRFHPGLGHTFQWSPNDGLDCDTCFSVYATPAKSTTYFVTITNPFGCSVLDSVRVNVLGAEFTGAGEDRSICRGEPVTLGTNEEEQNLRYEWSPARGLDDSTLARPTARPEETTTYVLRIVDRNTGCEARDSVTVSVFDPPSVDAGEDLDLCLGETIRLESKTDGTNLRYEWSPADELDDPFSPQPTAAPTRTTRFHLRVTDTLTGCESFDSLTLSVHAPPQADAGPDISICGAQEVRLGSPNAPDAPTLIYRWSPEATLVDPHLAQPTARPTASTLYILHLIDTATGCQSFDSVLVTVTEPRLLHLAIPRDIRAYPDQQRIVPITTDDDFSGSAIAELRLQIDFDGSMARIDHQQIERLLDGTLLDGWSVEIEEAVLGRLRLRLTAPPGRTLEGSGTLLNFPLRLYLSREPGTELRLSAEENAGCVAVIAGPGYAQLDTICGLNFRLIEFGQGKYVPPQAIPNPSGGRVHIEFGLGLEGPARLEVFDASGKRVAVLVDEALSSGRYEVDWEATDAGSGVYWLRLSSGEWSGVTKVMVE